LRCCIWFLSTNRACYNLCNYIFYCLPGVITDSTFVRRAKPARGWSCYQKCFSIPVVHAHSCTKPKQTRNNATRKPSSRLKHVPTSLSSSCHKEEANACHSNNCKCEREPGSAFLTDTPHYLVRPETQQTSCEKHNPHDRSPSWKDVALLSCHVCYASACEWCLPAETFHVLRWNPYKSHRPVMLRAELSA